MVIKSRGLTCRFPSDDPTQSKVQEEGIDVSMAVDLAGAAMNSFYGAMMVSSCDTDLLPALELVKREHLEIACWPGGDSLWLREGLRQTSPGHFPYCHLMKEQDVIETREACTLILTAIMHCVSMIVRAHGLVTESKQFL